MSLRFSSRNALVVSIVCVLLLVACLPWTTVQADGLGGQWPIEDPPSDSTGGGDGASDGVDTLVTLMTLMQLIL